MGKIFAAALVLVLAYFMFLKRSEPPKEVRLSEEQYSQDEPQSTEPSINQTIPLPQAAGTEIPPNQGRPAMPIVNSGAAAESAEDADLTEPGPAENVDQTVIANEKKLAAATSSGEVFDLLQKLRIRMKKLSEISRVASTANYAQFFGSYEGPIVNRRQESVYNLKLEIKQNTDPAMPTIYGNFEIDKKSDGKVKGDFNGDFGMQLVGRDGLVISNTLEMNNFQIYKLDNGMLAGNYYEKRNSSFKAYKFILKRK